MCPYHDVELEAGDNGLKRLDPHVDAPHDDVVAVGHAVIAVSAHPRGDLIVVRHGDAAIAPHVEVLQRMQRKTGGIVTSFTKANHY